MTRLRLHAAPALRRVAPMSKSLKRVRAALNAAGLQIDVVETALSRTAKDAADALGARWTR